MNTSNAAARRILVGLIIAALALACAFFGSSPGARSATSPEAPLLFTPRDACTSDSRSGRAGALLATAQAKLERYAFDLHEGPEALALLSEAAACYAAAGRDDEAASTRERLQRERTRIEDDYRRRRLRLTRALSTSDEDEARRESRELLDLLSGQHGPYVVWLQRIARSAP